MALHAVIIAGGSGTRFWPASRKALPKQFLRFETHRSLIRATAERLSGLVPMSRIWVVCGAAHAPLVREHLPELAAAHIVVEPEAKNTAPAIALANLHVLREDPDATVAILPADHFVRDESAFRSAVAQAADAATDGSMVTLGVKATRAETGFGYIERGEAAGPHAFRVARFIEKPPLADAERYAASGRHDWNGGIFVFSAKAFTHLLEQHAPDIAGPLGAHARGDLPLAEAFARMPSISIDYAVAERAQGMKVVPLDARWSDVGGWDALPDVVPPDADGNTSLARTLALDARENIVRADKRVCLVGVEGLIVVDTPDALLIMRRGGGQRVRELVGALQKEEPEIL